MANVQDVKRDPIKITLSDGVEREFKFTLNALAALEERYGSVEAAFEALEGNSIRALRLILFVGLQDSDETLTEERVGSMIDIASMQDLMDSLGKAFESDLPADKTGKGEAGGTPNE